MGFVLLCGISFFAAHNLSLSIVHYAQILVVCAIIINLSILLYNRLHLIYAIGLIAGFTGFFQAFTVLIHFKSFTDPLLISQFLNSSILEGNAGNMNIMSSGLLIKLPLVMLALTHYTGFRRVLLALALLAMFFCIFLINARTALITIPFIIGCYSVFFYSIRKHLNHRFIKLSYIFLPALFAFFLANFVLNNSGREGRYESTAARIAQINIDQSSTQARLWFWENGIDMVRDNPVFGVGIGNWMIEQIPYGKSRFVLSMNAHNDFIEVMAETGILNGLIYLSIFAALLFINIKRAWKFKDKRQQIIAFLALMILFVYGIDAVINFPLHRPTMQIGFAFLIVVSLINREYYPESKNNKNLFIALVLLSTIPIYVTWHAQRTSLLDRIVILDKIDVSASGKLTGDQLAAWGPKLPNVSRQTTVSYDEYTGIYYLREKRYEDAIRYLDKGNAIHSKLGRADYYKYIMSEERNMPDSAYFYLKNTFNNAPFYEGWYNQLVKYAGINKDTTTIFDSYLLYREASNAPSAIVW